MRARTIFVQLNSLSLGGTQLNAIDLAKAVECHGFRSVLVGPLPTLPRSGPSIIEVANARGVRLHGYCPHASVVPHRAKTLNHLASKIGADIVHVYGSSGDPRGAYWGPCLAGKRPLVHTVYEMAVAPNVYRHTSLVVGTKYLIEDLAGRPGSTELISPPVDVNANAPDETKAREFRAALGSLGNRSIVAVVSRLDLEMKSLAIETAIRAMPLIANTNALLIVVGTGSEEYRLRELGSHVNASVGRTLVHFTGAMADPRSAYAAADVVLGMGGSAARALAFATPLIVQGEQGTAELFDEDSATDLFRRSFWNPSKVSNGVERVAQQIQYLFERPARRRELGIYGRRFAVNNFSLTAMAERLAMVYESSLTGYGFQRWASDLNCELPQLVRNAARRITSLATVPLTKQGCL